MLVKTWEISKQLRNWLPRLQAHRGYWVAGHAENTLSSIQKAHELGYEMVEFDVRLTLDNQVVLFHDDHLSERLIRHIRLQEVKQHLPVNTLEQVFEWVTTEANNKLKLNIELKSIAILDDELEDRVVELIERFNLVDRVLISSFNPFALYRVRRLNQNIYRAILVTLETNPLNRWYFKRMFFNFLARPHMLNLRHEDWSKSKYGKTAEKVPVVLWTYNNVNDFKKLIGEVHGVISDEITPQMFQS